MCSGKQLKDDRECLKVDKFGPNRVELGKSLDSRYMETCRRSHMPGCVHSFTHTHTHAHTHTTPPFVLGVIPCRSVSRDIPLWFSKSSLTHCQHILFPRRTLRPVCSSRGSPWSLGAKRLPWVHCTCLLWTFTCSFRSESRAMHTCRFTFSWKQIFNKKQVDLWCLIWLHCKYQRKKSCFIVFYTTIFKRTWDFSLFFLQIFYGHFCVPIWQDSWRTWQEMGERKGMTCSKRPQDGIKLEAAAAKNSPTHGAPAPPTEPPGRHGHSF